MREFFRTKQLRTKILERLRAGSPKSSKPLSPSRRTELKEKARSLGSRFDELGMQERPPRGTGVLGKKKVK